MRPSIPQSFIPLLCLVSMVLAIGCKNVSDGEVPTEESASGGSESVLSAEESISGPRKATAMKAKDALFERLSGRLVEVMQSEGPAAAIRVCSEEATQIAEVVGSEHGVRIGRTSFKLRNAKNAPRDWVKPYVDAKVETAEFTTLENGDVGALFPIHINVKCLMCHGQTEDILDEVRAELSQRYPSDSATGFELGDLRGWFWVEVPSEAG